MKALIIILIIVIIVVVWYLFRPEKSFISKRVNEVFPDVNETGSSSKSAIKVLYLGQALARSNQSYKLLLNLINEAPCSKLQGYQNIN